jgi:uncharacterized membrane protein YjgN (DUF898 family)
MDEPGRKEPHLGANPYADPGAAAAATTPSPPQATAAGDPINLFFHKLFHTTWSPPQAKAAASSPQAAAAGETRYAVEFTASAGEYFRIWIVNLALSILTLGIYSAWAKVRKKRYFYGHTLIDGESFDYRANPLGILKGRIIAVVLFAAYSFGGKISPVLGGIFALVLVFAMPWLIVRSLAFNAHNSAYRNIRFNFRGTYWEPLKLIIGGGLLVIVSLGIGYPYLKARLVRFAARNHAYGTTSFDLSDITGSYYGVYLKALGLAILSAIVVGIVAAGLGVKGMRSGVSGAFVVFMIVIYATYLLLYAYVHAQTTNVTWNALAIGPLRFESTLRGRDLAGIYLVNILAIIVTLGLATPWAVVRTMRYRAEKITLVTAGGLADFVATEAGNVSATGEAIGEMFDFDFGL